MEKTVDKTKVNVKTYTYPLVEDIVESLYEECESLLDKYLDNQSDKSIFLMFVIMYMSIHMKLRDNLFADNKETRKSTIKHILTEFIRDHRKRQLCIQMFENKFRFIFQDETGTELIEEIKNLKVLE